METLSFGRKTMEGMPAAAQYEATAAEVSPVDAQATARTSRIDRIRCTMETRTVIPKSLKDPVCEVPHCLIQIASTPNADAKPAEGSNGELPSPKVTMCRSSISGSTTSFLDHTPLARPNLASNKAFQSSPERSLSAATS